MRFNSLTFVTAGLLLTAPFVVAQATKTLTGTVSDAMCGKKHMMAGKSAAECTRECVEEGSDYALVVGDRVYTLKGDKIVLNRLAGENVTVIGRTNGNTLTVLSVKAAK